MSKQPFYIHRLLYKQVVKRPIAAILVLLGLIYLTASVLIMFSEDVNFPTAATMIMPAFLGELGIVESRSIVTQASLLSALLVSVAFLAVITARITSIFIDFMRTGGSIVKKVKFSNHIIICGWNFQGEKIIKELLSPDTKTKRNIVVLENCEQRPTKDERVEFVRGDPTQDEALIRAGVKTADSVIVLSDLNKSANESDAEALMIVLAVESLNRAVHSSVQIVNSSNRIHLERAHADEIICLDQMGGNFVVASAINHGISRVVSELLSFNAGSEFYRYDKKLPDDIVGKDFTEVSRTLMKRRIILIGIETDDSQELRKHLKNNIVHSVRDGTKAIFVNPQTPYEIKQGDALFIIAESEPSFL
jgi:voltage-gated potassium channel